MHTLEALNHAEEEDAVRLLEPLIERAPAIARRVARRRPFWSADDLSRAIRRELEDLDEDQCLELFRAHPELAPTNPLTMTPASQSEQGRLNLTVDDNAFRSRLDALNASYRERFGFPFITALARHRDMHSVLAEFEERLHGDIASEMARALEQVTAVSAARVQAMFGNEDRTPASADTGTGR